MNEMFGGQLALARLHFDQTTARATDAMWLTGHESGPAQAPFLILIGDSVPDDTSSTATLTVGAPHTIGTTETIGDQDFYRVQLDAGVTYEIGMYAYPGPGTGGLPGPGGIPQADSYVEIYDASGNLIVSGDGGAHTLYNNLNSGFDVLLTFTPETSGLFYVNARAYDEDPTNGTTGDTVGDYELFVQVAPTGGYRPYYDVDSPLYALDWGTQVDGSSRNPDGAEGPRPTGNDFTGHAWNEYGITGKNVITYYFARQGEIFIDEDPTTPGTTDTIVASGFEQWEKDVYLNAFGAYSKVADIVYVEVQDRTDADFVLITYEGTPGPGVSLLGRMSPPDEENEGRTEFNANDQRWTEEGLAPGGFSFNTLIHELGHGHGMAHPHDNGGRSGIMQGVEPEGVAFDYTNGDFDLNQGIYTMMSYEDGWQKSPYGQPSTNDPYGWLGSLMAFDVAVIQDKYGVNEEWATGNDTYVLKDVNAAGTFYSCIWDAGGTDSIVYYGARDANIDLRPATLRYEAGGGGWVSYAFGIHGGFTIANGVTIENAMAGSGNDTLIGNDAANALSGGSGNDQIVGGLGGDFLFGDDGGDSLNGGGGGDYLDGGAARDGLRGGEGDDHLVGGGEGDWLFGEDGSDSLIGGDGDDWMEGGAGRDGFHGGAGADQIVGGADGDWMFGEGDGDSLIGGDGDDWMEGGEGRDGLHGGAGNDRMFGGADGDWLFGEGDNDIIVGEDGNDFIEGGEGDDLLVGGAGQDVLLGGAGADAFAFVSALGAGNVDGIGDFNAADDVIQLDDAVFVGLGLGGLAPGAFAIGTAAQDADDRIIYDPNTGALYFDGDGSGTGVGAIQFAAIAAGTPLTAADFVVI
jgi:Ca2+-binding RTX toxin-like protein